MEVLDDNEEEEVEEAKQQEIRDDKRQAWKELLVAVPGSGTRPMGVVQRRRPSRMTLMWLLYPYIAQ